VLRRLFALRCHFGLLSDADKLAVSLSFPWTRNLRSDYKEHVITTSKDGYRFIDLATGTTTKSILGQGGSKMAVTVLSNDRVLTRIDSAHGSNNFIWLGNLDGEVWKADGNTDRRGDVTGTWSPPHATTNSYSSKPMMFILADGRLWLRGADGLYCYDLRKNEL
jgi:hypothetical protein